MKKPEVSTWGNLPENIRKAVIENNLASLRPEERIKLYEEACIAKGLDPAGRPFEFISFKNKVLMYARKEASDQLRERNGISTTIVTQSAQGSVYVVHIRATDKDGRSEDDIGATGIAEAEFYETKTGEKKPNPRYGKPLEALDMANAMMKAVTKGKRRATLAICGLGMFDESEVESMADADRGKAPTLEEVQRIAAEVMALKEQAAKAPKKEAQELIRQACALEASILDQPGSGHTPEGQPAQTAVTPTNPGEQPPRTAAGVAKTPEQTATGKTDTAQGSIVVTGQTGVTTEDKPLIQEAAKQPEAPKEPVKQPESPKAAETPAAPAPQAASASQSSVVPWREHQILMVPHRQFKGKKLGEVAHEFIKVVHENWALKFAEEVAKVPEKRADAAAIAAAVKELGL